MHRPQGFGANPKGGNTKGRGPSLHLLKGAEKRVLTTFESPQRTQRGYLGRGPGGGPPEKWPGSVATGKHMHSFRTGRRKASGDTSERPGASPHNGAGAHGKRIRGRKGRVTRTGWATRKPKWRSQRGRMDRRTGKSEYRKKTLGPLSKERDRETGTYSEFTGGTGKKKKEVACLIEYGGREATGEEKRSADR